MSYKKLLLLVGAFFCLFLVFKGSVYAGRLPCWDTGGGGDTPFYATFNYKSYSCNWNPQLPNPGCFAQQNPGAKSACSGYDAQNRCTASIFLNQTCTDRRVTVCTKSQRVCDTSCYTICLQSTTEYKCSYTYPKKTVLCSQPKSCQHTTVNCNTGNKCGKWSISCGDTKDCGGCNNNTQTCQANSDSQTSSGGNCVAKPPTCTPTTCAKLGADGTKGAACDKQSDNCGSTITCGGCNSPLNCTGKNGNGVGGSCTPPPSTSDNVTILVFYDASEKGTQSSYNYCYPATNGSGAGAASGTVSITMDSADSGVAIQTYPKTSYKNCRSDGRTSSPKGFTITRTDNSRSIKLNTPSGYKATGYNYSVNNGAFVTCTTSSTSSKCNRLANQTPNLSGDVTVNFGIVKVVNPPTPQVVGKVFIDDNENDQFELNSNNEACYSGNVTIKVGGTSHTIKQTADPVTGDCNFFSYDNTSSAQTIQLNPIPNGFIATGFEYQDSSHPPCNPNNGNGWCLHDSSANDTSESIDLAGDSVVYFGIKPVPNTFTVSGSIFVDSDSDKREDNGESNYTAGANSTRTIAAFAVSDSGVVDSSPTDTGVSGGGGYSLSLPSAGEYKIEYIDPSSGTTGPPSDYNRETNPADRSIPPTFTVSVGNGNCWINARGQTTYLDAGCSGGNIAGLNFGISNAAQAWFQSIGGDMRIDDAFTDLIPSGQYASIVSSTLLSPGILFTGQSSAQLTSSGSQNASASTKGWLVTSTPYNPVGAGTRSSYEYLSAVLARGGIITKPMWGDATTPCGSASKPNCTLPNPKANNSPADSFPGGVYTASLGLTIQNSTTYQFAANTNYIFLIDGDLEIQGDITVPTTSTVVFAVSGKIIVDSNVKEIDGIYSTDQLFDVSNGSNQLVVNGSVISNANLQVSANSIDDVFNNDRSMANNSTTPSVVFTMRPDFILNLPETLKVPNYVVQEVAPGPSFSFGTSQGNSPVTPMPTITPTPTVTPAFTPSPTPGSTPGFRADATSGKLVIEAESVHGDRTDGSNGHSWANGGSSPAYVTTATGSISGPGINCSGGNAAEVDYPVYFTVPGTYYFYLRIDALDQTNSSLVGVGVDCAQTNVINWGSSTGGWLWADQNSQLNEVKITVTQAQIDAGVHYVNIWEREGGSQVDKIVIQTNSGVPSGTTESPFN